MPTRRYTAGMSSVPAAANFRSFTSAIKSTALREIAFHWLEARGYRRMPTWEDLSPVALKPHFALLWGYRYDPQIQDFIGRLPGQHITEWLGTDFWGKRLRDIHPPHVFLQAHQLMTRVITTPAACRMSGKLFTIGDKSISGERIALPLASDGIHGDGVLGASDFEMPAKLGQVELYYENMEWYSV
jgi:hypothetical protein